MDQQNITYQDLLSMYEDGYHTIEKEEFERALALLKHNFASLCLTKQPWLVIIVFVAGPQARRLCPDYAEEDLEGREIRLRGNIIIA